MESIKRIIREKLPETNSSSSHSVVISTKKDYTVDETLKLNSNGDLEIPSRDFGWEWEKYNDCMTKLQYVLGILSNSRNNKKLKILFDIVKEMTGANSVMYDSKNPIEIDHNSSDIFSEIIESKESIKSFIFSKNSWLFTGNDNSDEPIGFYILDDYYNNHINNPRAIITIEFGGNIGNVDIELYNYPLPDSNNIDISGLDNDECFSDILYNFSTNEFICFHNRWGCNDTTSLSQYKIMDIDNSCIYYINKNMYDSIRNLSDKDYKILGRYEKTVSEYFFQYKDSLLKDSTNKFVKVNYFITSNEFGIVK